MRAIILAAGRGNRMGTLTDNHPKAFLKINNKPLIEWQMQAIREAGINEIAIVTGYHAEVFTYPVNYFHNSHWDKTNMLSTLQCADDWLNQDTCIISYSDIIYSAEAIKKLISSKGDIAITYDPHWLQLWQQRFDDPLTDAEVFKYSNDELIDIGGKTTSLLDIQAQYMGLLKFTPKGWDNTKKFLDQFDKPAVARFDMTGLLKSMLKKYKIHVVAATSPWCEVDNEKDYEIAQKIFNDTAAKVTCCVTPE